MSNIDLSDIYDSCFTGHTDVTAEISLRRDTATGEWKNDSVKFYKTGYGWAYEETDGRWDYGYDSLEEAVTKYTGRLAAESAKVSYIASRWFEKQYDHKHVPGTPTGDIYCKVTKRMFKGSCDNDRLRHINDAVSDVLSKLAS